MCSVTPHIFAARRSVRGRNLESMPQGASFRARGDKYTRSDNPDPMLEARHQLLEFGLSLRMFTHNGFPKSTTTACVDVVVEVVSCQGAFVPEIGRGQ